MLGNDFKPVCKMFLNLHIHRARPAYEDEQFFLITQLQYTLKQAYLLLTLNVTVQLLKSPKQKVPFFSKLNSPSFIATLSFASVCNLAYTLRSSWETIRYDNFIYTRYFHQLIQLIIYSNVSIKILLFMEAVSKIYLKLRCYFLRKRQTF